MVKKAHESITVPAPRIQRKLQKKRLWPLIRTTRNVIASLRYSQEPAKGRRVGWHALGGRWFKRESP